MTATAAQTNERPSPTPAQETASGASLTQLGAITTFTSTYINWNAGDVTQRMRILAASSIGQARSAMQLAAAQTSADYELEQGGIANSGTIEAIAPLAGARLTYVVVTRERTTAATTAAYQGLRPAWHVAVAAVQELAPGRWVVSRWQPEN